MAYTINLTNGTTFATITDGTVNTASSMTLIGKNYAGYGQFLDDNFIHLLENSANTTAPAAPLTGQLWWDSTNTLLKVYAGGAGWKALGVTTASSSQPSPSIIGDLWYDTVNQQLKVCSVAGAPGTFIVVGPAYSSAQGTSGAVPITISDGSTGYIVTGLYANNNLVGIISGATDFVPAGNSSGYATAFPTIYKGFTVWNTGNASGNISNPGNITLAVAGSVIETVASTGVYVTGLVTASGNVIGGNIRTAGLITATGNVTSGNVLTGGLITATGNVDAGNLRTAGLITATGNITSGNVLTAGQVSATGNVTGANFIGNVIPPAGGAVSTTGNITGGNIIFGSGVVTGTGNIIGGNVLFGSGIVSGTGNVAGGYIFGNGSQLTGVSAAVSVTKFQNGTTEGNAGSSGGNINFNIGGTSNVMVLATTGAIVNGLSTPSIEHTGTNAVGNIGSSSSYFNRLFATATTALYADVAERFAADEELAAGTVVELGGTAEITKSQQELSENVFGVISTRAAYLMNGGAGEDNTHPPVAMTGRVPVQVVGVVRKGDRLVSAGSGVARAAQPGEATAFNVIGRALVDKLTAGPGTIEAIVTIK
jgi:filamentous hemagglutinin